MTSKIRQADYKHVTIVALLPDDIGLFLNPKGEEEMIVEECCCERCGGFGTPAVAIIETFEADEEYTPCALCQDCLEELEKEKSGFFDACDVPDRPGFFKVCVESVRDSSWNECHELTTSYQEAVSILRREEFDAKDHGGLKPNKGVQEITKEEYLKTYLRWKAADDAASVICDDDDSDDHLERIMDEMELAELQKAEYEYARAPNEFFKEPK